MNEKQIVDSFISWIKQNHKNWDVQTEVSVGLMRADGCIYQVTITKTPIAYFEAKAEGVSLKSLLTGLAQAQYVKENVDTPVWLILKNKEVEKLLKAKKENLGDIHIFNLDQQRLIKPTEIEQYVYEQYSVPNCDRLREVDELIKKLEKNGIG